MYRGRFVFSNVIRFAAAAVLILSLGACGGGSSDGSGFVVGAPMQQLDGAWFGSLEDPVGGLHTYQVTVSGDAVSQILIDGVDQGLTGTITKESDVLFSLVLSDGAEAGFIVDAAVQHAVFVDDSFNFAVVQKGVSGLPVFLVNDVDGNWSGNTIITDFVISSEFASTASCTNLLCTASGNGVNASIDLSGSFDATFGQWAGTFNNSAGESGVARALLSADKLFAGSYTCDNAGSFPDACDFSAWVRQ